jgi:ATP-dependent helicase/nuclease subunit A
MSAPAYRSNGVDVSRSDFYAVACDPRRSVAVEACAGAGKTWMLVSRIVRALLDGAQPQEILAITFTKKAAGEMRQRLQEWLAEFVRSTPQQLEAELVARGLSPQRARDGGVLLQQLYPALLACDRSVQIRTFHSWFAALLRSAPMGVMQALGLPLQHELLEDDAPAVAQVWRPFYAALVADAQARADYEAVVAVHGRFQAQKALASALQKRVEFALADAQGVVDASVLRFGEQFPEFCELDTPEQALLQPGPGRNILYEAAKALGGAKAPTFSAKGVDLERALGAGDASGVLAALLTQKGEPRKFGEKIVGIELIRQAQQLALGVMQARAQFDAWLYQQRMARLTRLLIQTFSALKRERGWVDMNDVESAALVLLGDERLSGWMQQRLDARIRQLLIDEFQDTNPLQWQALHAWLSGYAGAGGGGGTPSVFIVGDPKQSIYRFRRAEPQVFRAAQAFVREGLGGDLLQCDHTRRNAPEVISLVNEVMQAAQAAQEYEGFREHTTESVEAGSVACLPQIARDARLKEAGDGDAQTHWRDSLTTPRELAEETFKTLECRQAAAWLAQQLQQGLQPKDILVLARKRDRLSVMQEELRALHIPAQQPEKSDLSEAPAVQDIVALLDALVSPAHDLSLAQALKSPLFGVSDDDLVSLALLQKNNGGLPPTTGNSLPRPSGEGRGEGSSARPTWFELLQQASSLPSALSGIGLTLLRWQGWLAALPPHDALAAIYHDGDVLARFAAATPAALRTTVLAQLRSLLAASLQLDASRYATPYALVRLLKAGGIRAPVTAEMDAVRLLTIHGAKGLEAKLVLLLDADAPPPNAQSMGVLIDWPGEAAAPERFVFLASESTPPYCARVALLAEQLARQREEVNALYVAMTRAKHRLVLSSVQPHREALRSWWQRLAPLCAPLAQPETAASAGSMLTRPESAIFTLPVLPELPMEMQAKDATLVERDLPLAADSAESVLGQAMHRLLEWAPLGASVCSAIQMQALAVEFELDESQVRQAAAMAQSILTGEAAWAWNAERIAWHGNEVALTWQGQCLRLDRLLQRRDSGEWWVLDYKSSTQPQADADLVAQLHSYRDAVQAAYPGEVVRAAFLSANGRFIEIT